jgi:hypothetical protein
MKLRTLMTAATVTMLPLFNAGAQVNLPAGSTSTQVSDLMIALQFQHIKLWFAGKLSNWDLANYELRLIQTNLKAVPSPSEACDRPKLPNSCKLWIARSNRRMVQLSPRLTRISRTDAMPATAPADSVRSPFRCRPTRRSAISCSRIRSRRVARSLTAPAASVTPSRILQGKHQPFAFPRRASAKLPAGHLFQPTISESY